MASELELNGQIFNELMTGYCRPNLQMRKFDINGNGEPFRITCLSLQTRLRLRDGPLEWAQITKKSQEHQSCKNEKWKYPKLWLSESLLALNHFTCTASLWSRDYTEWVADSRKSNRLLLQNYVAFFFFFFFGPRHFSICLPDSPSLLQSCKPQKYSKWVFYFRVSLPKYSIPSDLQSLWLPALWKGKLAASWDRDLAAVTKQGMCVLSQGLMTSGFLWSALLP